MSKRRNPTLDSRSFRALAVFGALILALFISLPAFAAETIQRFVTEIVVETDGAVGITEVIEISVEGNQI